MCYVFSRAFMNVSESTLKQSCMRDVFFYRCRKWGSGRSNSSPKVMWPRSTVAGIQTGLAQAHFPSQSTSPDRASLTRQILSPMFYHLLPLPNFHHSWNPFLKAPFLSQLHPLKVLAALWPLCCELPASLPPPLNCSEGWACPRYASNTPLSDSLPKTLLPPDSKHDVLFLKLLANDFLILVFIFIKSTHAHDVESQIVLQGLSLTCLCFCAEVSLLGINSWILTTKDEFSSFIPILGTPLDTLLSHASSPDLVRC